MSLINQMLQDLDARRAETSGAMPYGEQVRAVPERRSIHPAWWVVLALAVILAAVLAWLLLRPVPPAAVVQQSAPPRLPLKLDTDMDLRASHGLPPGVEKPIPPAADTVTPAAGGGAAAPALPSAPGANPLASVPSQQSPDAEHAAALSEAASIRPAREPAGAIQRREIGHPVSREPAKIQLPTRPHVTAPHVMPSKVPSSGTVDKQFKVLTPQQQAENEYRKAILLLQQGRATEAGSELEACLQLDPRHVGARQVLIGVLLDTKRPDDAARSAREGLELDPRQADLAMILARLQLEKGDLHTAITTLERTLPYASEQADYQAFLAALLQRDNQHKQAIEHYLQALQKTPQNGVWWMGLGISLQADHRLAEAREAFTRAKASNSLSADLQAFVSARLSQLERF